jgi:hypothetical protein
MKSAEEWAKIIGGRHTLKEREDMVEAIRKEQREACWRDVDEGCIWLYDTEREEIKQAILNAGEKK